MNETIAVVVIVVVVAAIAVGTVLIVRRQLWKKRLRELGWNFVNSPDLRVALPRANPPFDCGFERKIDDLITGTTSAGVPFEVYQYGYRAGGGNFFQRMAVVQLPLPLPQLYLTSTRPRAGVMVPAVEVDPNLPFTTLADDPGYAKTVLNSGVSHAVAHLARPGPGDKEPRAIDLSIDGDSLVGGDAPTDPDRLRDYLERLGAVAAAIDPAAVEPYRIEPKAPRLGFHGQDWTLVGVDNSLIGRFEGITPFGQGHGHQTENVITGTARGTVPLTAFKYHWKTTHTRTVSDGKGGTRTETYTKNHEQPILALTLPATTPTLAVGPDVGALGRLFTGGTIDFESSHFNEAFDVTSDHAKFAHDVMHPRMMEFLLQARPPQLIMVRGMLVTYPQAHDTVQIAQLAYLLTDFLAWVPDFVWRDLGTVSPVPVAAE